MRQTRYQCEAFPPWARAGACGVAVGQSRVWVLLWWELRCSSSSAEGSQPVLLVWDTWGCCLCSEGRGCGQVQKTESASPSIIQSLGGGGEESPVCSCAFYELLFCFEGGNLSELARENPSGSPHSSGTHLALGRRRPGLGTSSTGRG